MTHSHNTHIPHTTSTLFPTQTYLLNSVLNCLNCILINSWSDIVIVICHCHCQCKCCYFPGIKPLLFLSRFDSCPKSVFFNCVMLEFLPFLHLTHQSLFVILYAQALINQTLHLFLTLPTTWLRQQLTSLIHKYGSATIFLNPILSIHSSKHALNTGVHIRSNIY